MSVFVRNIIGFSRIRNRCMLFLSNGTSPGSTAGGTGLRSRTCRSTGSFNTINRTRVLVVFTESFAFRGSTPRTPCNISVRPGGVTTGLCRHGGRNEAADHDKGHEQGHELARCTFHILFLSFHFSIFNESCAAPLGPSYRSTISCHCEKNVS